MEVCPLKAISRNKSGVVTINKEECVGFCHVRFVCEALGQPVTWEGKTTSIYVGKGPEGAFKYLEDLTPSSDVPSSYWKKEFVDFTTNTGDIYLHGIQAQNGLLEEIDKESRVRAPEGAP